MTTRSETADRKIAGGLMTVSSKEKAGLKLKNSGVFCHHGPPNRVEAGEYSYGVDITACMHGQGKENRA